MIVPGLWQRGTEDDDVVSVPGDDVRLRGSYPFDVVVTLFASARPVPWRDGGRHHQDINKPLVVFELLQEWASQAEGERILACFVPLKCEKWVRTRTERQGLFKAVRGGYSAAIGGLGHHPALRVTCAPVQTVGSIEHESIERKDSDTFVSHYRGQAGNGQYSPQWAVEPMRQVLQAVIRGRLDNTRFWERLRRLFGHQVDLEAAVEDLETLQAPRKVWQEGVARS